MTLVGHCDLAGLWTSRNKNAVFLLKFKSTAYFFCSSSRRKPLLPLCEIQIEPFAPNFKASLAFLQYLLDAFVLTN